MSFLPVQVLDMRRRCEVVNRITRARLDCLILPLMRECGLDMWIVICLEDNLDPVFQSMVPMDAWAPVLQILVLYDRGDERIERINISRTDFRGWFETPFEVTLPEDQWERLQDVVLARDPQRIGINQASVAWAADGLSATLKERLIATLPQTYVERLQPAERLCRRWFETLIEDEFEIYPHVVSVTRGLEREFVTRRNITPGVTTTEDLKWAFWQECANRGLELVVPRPKFVIERDRRAKKIYGENDNVIRAGDLLHWDISIKYLRLVTDNHQWAYVLRDGEVDVPAGIAKIFNEGLRLQDIYIGEFRQGRTGNEILRSALEKARDEGLDTPRIFSHSIGRFIHEPGPLIGHSLAQEGWAGRGDVELNYDTCFVTEVSIDGSVPEWGGTRIRMQQEEQISFRRAGVRYISGRQEAIFAI